MKTVQVQMLNMASVPEPLAEMLEDRYGTEYRSALMSGDVLLLQGVLGNAWKFYLQRAPDYSIGGYDAITGKTYGTKMFSSGVLLYKEYFGVLPPLQTRGIIEDAVNKHGLTSVSVVYKEWRDKKWNPRNIYGMMEKVRKDAKEAPLIQPLAEIFQEEE